MGPSSEPGRLTQGLMLMIGQFRSRAKRSMTPSCKGPGGLCRLPIGGLENFSRTFRAFKALQCSDQGKAQPHGPWQSTPGQDMALGIEARSSIKRLK